MYATYDGLIIRQNRGKPIEYDYTSTSAMWQNERRHLPPMGNLKWKSAGRKIGTQVRETPTKAGVAETMETGKFPPETPTESHASDISAPGE